MKATKILFVNHTAQLGGGEFVLRDIASHYRDHCHVALFSDGPLRDLLRRASVPVSVIPVNPTVLNIRRRGRILPLLSAAPAILAAAGRLARVARNYDVLYPNSQKAAIVAMLAGMLLNRPVVWHLHDILSGNHFGAVQRRTVVTLANRVAHLVLANSSATRDAFVACGGDPARITVVQNGIDPLPFFAISDADATRLRRQLGIGGGSLVGVFGRLAPWKGQHLLIQALPQLPNVQALVVGDALFGEFAYRQFILDQIRTLGVGKRVHMLGFRSDLPQLMRAVDLVVHTSTEPEPFGRVIVEGMFARRPVVASDGGAAREVLGPSSIDIIPPGDPTALAHSIARLLAAAPDQTAALTTANLARAKNLFSIERMLAGIDQALQTVT